MAHKELVLLLLFSLGTRVLSSLCPPCANSICPPTNECTAGITKLYCGCCDYCAKVHNDRESSQTTRNTGVQPFALARSAQSEGKVDIKSPHQMDPQLNPQQSKVRALGTHPEAQAKYFPLPKDLGETCGGYWDQDGKCGRGLRCHIPHGNIFWDSPTDIYPYTDVTESTCTRVNSREFTLDGANFIVLEEHNGTTWEEARNLCQKSGYELAQPWQDVSFTKLASYLLTNYGNTYYWLGGKGNGTHIAWLSGDLIDSGSPLWRAPDHGFQSSTNFCLYLREDGNPNPLGTYNCQDTHYMTPLCEVHYWDMLQG